MEKLRIKYCEMYTIVPAEMSSQVEECQKALEDLDEKVRGRSVPVSAFMVLSDGAECTGECHIFICPDFFFFKL